MSGAPPQPPQPPKQPRPPPRSPPRQTPRRLGDGVRRGGGQGGGGALQATACAGAGRQWPNSCEAPATQHAPMHVSESCEPRWVEPQFSAWALPGEGPPGANLSRPARPGGANGGRLRARGRARRARNQEHLAHPRPECQCQCQCQCQLPSPGRAHRRGHARERPGHCGPPAHVASQGSELFVCIGARGVPGSTLVAASSRQCREQLLSRWGSPRSSASYAAHAPRGR